MAARRSSSRERCPHIHNPRCSTTITVAPSHLFQALKVAASGQPAAQPHGPQCSNAVQPKCEVIATDDLGDSGRGGVPKRRCRRLDVPQLGRCLCLLAAPLPSQARPLPHQPARSPRHAPPAASPHLNEVQAKGRHPTLVQGSIVRRQLLELGKERGDVDDAVAAFQRQAAMGAGRQGRQAVGCLNNMAASVGLGGAGSCCAGGCGSSCHPAGRLPLLHHRAQLRDPTCSPPRRRGALCQSGACAART